MFERRLGPAIAIVAFVALFAPQTPADETPTSNPAAKIGDTVPNGKGVSPVGIQVTFRPKAGRYKLIYLGSARGKDADDGAKAAIVLYRRFHAKGLDVLGVYADRSTDRALQFAERWQLPWPILMDAGEAKPSVQIGLGAPGANVLVNADGKVAAVNLGGEAAHAAVAKALGVSLDAVPKPAEPEPRTISSSQQPYRIVVDDEVETFGTKAEREAAEGTKRNLRRISLALVRYRQDHNGQMPEWLSDLYPKYLTDESILLCPDDPTPPEGFDAYVDPKMKCSFLYEFAPKVRETKTQQLGVWGDKVAVVRCLKYARPLSLSYGGEIYFSPMGWESAFPTGQTLDSKDAKVRARLMTLAVALDQYKKDKGEVPETLDALYPDYVKDKTLLNSPITNKPFRYAFAPNEESEDKEAYRASKRKQLEQYGSYVPILRARGAFANGNVMNLSYGGEIYNGRRWKDLFE
jgi:hypothetical protein